MSYLAKKYGSKGFTLLEVLIAVAIFSVISLASFSIFQTVQSSDEGSRLRSERMNELQRAFLVIERDMLQILRRTVRLNGEAPLDGYLHRSSDSYSGGEQVLAFVRGGWSNPGMLLPRSDVQSVAYQLNDGNFERLHFNFVDAVVGEEPKVRRLMSQVESLEYEFFYDKRWQKDLEAKKLPKAIAIEVELQEYGVIRRQFLVAAEDQGQDEKDN